MSSATPFWPVSTNTLTIISSGKCFYVWTPSWCFLVLFILENLNDKSVPCCLVNDPREAWWHTFDHQPSRINDYFDFLHELCLHSSVPEYGINAGIWYFEFSSITSGAEYLQLKCPKPKTGKQMRNLKVADFMLLSWLHTQATPLPGMSHCHWVKWPEAIATAVQSIFPKALIMTAPLQHTPYWVDSC